jgi:superfamily I DNA/RNA helicase
MRKISDRRFAGCYTSYRKLMEDEKWFDFSSILHKFVETVKNNRTILTELGKRVKHVIVDEYQDIQLSFVSPLNLELYN